MSQLSCGTSRIVGCRFSIYPMSDRFVELFWKRCETQTCPKYGAIPMMSALGFVGAVNMYSMSFSQSFYIARQVESMLC